VLGKVTSSSAEHNLVIGSDLFELATRPADDGWEYLLTIPRWAAEDREMLELCTEFIDAINETRLPSVGGDREA